jgi:hypothetical protein
LLKLLALHSVTRTSEDCLGRRLGGSSIVGRKDDANHGAGGAVGVFPDFVIVVNVILALSYPPDDQGV